MSVDPAVAKTGQPYQYANSNPVNESDPTGLSGNGVDLACSGGELLPKGVTAAQACAIAKQGAAQVSKEECTNNPEACSNVEQYYSACATFGVFFEVCGTWGGGNTYVDLGVGAGSSGATLSVGDIHGGSSQQLLGGWSAHAGADYGIGGGWAQTLSCPAGEGARGPYATVGVPGAGDYFSYGIKL